MPFPNNDPAPKLPTVSENVLKKRRSTNRDVIKAQRARSTEIRRKNKKFQALFKRPAHFINKERKIAREKLRLERYAKKKAPINVSETPKLGIVVRLKHDNAVPAQAVKVLELLNLVTCNQAVFIKVTKPMLELLTIIEPYIIWGYPTLLTVRDIILKHGRAFREGRRHSIDNRMIEHKLGKFGILCMEDLIHELVTLGPNFREVCGFLIPFKLFPPTAGWTEGIKRCKAASDSLTGYREEHINEMLKKMI